jgi:ectoine hydroxylase-related dioxygenase (phytanoyl-CoA dioxygenase family)
MWMLQLSAGTFLLLLVVFLNSAEATTKENDREAALRLLQASLSSPNANVDQLISDAKRLFSDVLSEEDLGELLAGMDVNEEQGKAVPEKDAQETGGAGTSDGEARTCTNNDPDHVHVSHLDLPYYADRHIKRINSVPTDYDCMEREFDFSSPDFNVTEAAIVFAKCRMLVARNVFDPKDVETYRTTISNYLSSLHEGRTPSKGKTTTGESIIYAQRHEKRFDVLLPRQLAKESIVADYKVTRMLEEDRVLGKTMIANQVGVVISETGSEDQHYHHDDQYLFLESSFDFQKVSGHDLAPFAVTMFFPNINMTVAHGPTEFCMGSSHLRGFTVDSDVEDENLLLSGDTPFHKLAIFDFFAPAEGEDDKVCPEELVRTPLANVGDVVFFDYNIMHRGLENTSPDLRAMSYVIYSRPWFKDANFDEGYLGSLSHKQNNETLMKRLTKKTRYAVADDYTDDCEGSPCPERVPLKSIENFLDPQ